MVLKEVRVVLFLLFVVATAGLMMRSWNWVAELGIDFYNLRQAHSHLAFLGWVFPAIIILYNRLFIDEEEQSVDRFLFWTFIVINVLMFGAFIEYGYTGPSIILLSVHTALAFAYAWRFLNRMSNKLIQGTRLLVVSSIVTMCISFLGPLAIPVIKNTGGGPDQMKLAIHFYLHFQYNVFFVLAVLAMMSNRMKAVLNKLPVYLTLLGMFGTYFVTVSWGINSELLHLLGAGSALVQLVGIVWLLKKLKPFERNHGGVILQFLMVTVVGSLVLKSALQTGSYWFPQLSMEGGIHFWVIAFLHLIFLGVVTPYLLFEFVENRFMSRSKSIIGIGLLLIGIVLTETILGLQGMVLYVPSLTSSIYPLLLQIGSFIIWLATGMLFALSLIDKTRLSAP